MLKLLSMGALVLILLIPLAMITGVLNDPLQRRNEAVTDITSSWRREQNVGLRLVDRRDRAVRCARNRDVCDSQSRLVRAGPRLAKLDFARRLAETAYNCRASAAADAAPLTGSH